MGGSRIVVCKDKAEALRMHDAGLLVVRRADGTWVSGRVYALSNAKIAEVYGKCPWEADDFGYMVEDDEDGQQVAEDRDTRSVS